MEIVTSIAGRVGDFLFNEAGRQVGYLLNYSDNIESLKKQTEKLADMRERLRAKVDAAERNNEVIEADVGKWMENVRILTEGTEKFIEEESKAKMRCFGGCCINLSLRYKFSKSAQKKTTDVAEILKDGNFESVSHPAPPPGIISSSTGLLGTFESRKSIVKEIMEALINESVNLIGVCGMGGVGKTTVVKDIAKKAKEKKLFDESVMAVVSQNQRIEDIQEEISKMLGLTLSNSSQQDRARMLWARMEKQKRLLIILDDVWRRLELADVGIPFGPGYKDIKIIFTTRSEDVCNQMLAQKIVKVGVLSVKESWDLFREAAGGIVDSSDIRPIAREIAAKCDGLPIALVTVGTALKNKEKPVWKDAARQLKKSTPASSLGIAGNVFPKLELSYNFLESTEAKSCFLLCSLFPEDFDIPVEMLMRLGMALNVFQEVDTMEEARSRAHTVVSVLTAAHLLLTTNRESYVKMHDIVRDFAISIASKEKHAFLVKARIGLRDWPSHSSFQNLSGISLMSNDIHELPDSLDCPNLQILLLQNNFSLKIQENFFQTMKELKVLDLSYIHAIPIPSSFSFLENLQTLFLDRCKLSNVSVIGQLIKLEILSLSSSDIEEIPTSFGQLTSLRLFDLTGCWGLKAISPGIISKLRKLEELYMSHSFFQWDVEVEGESRINASILELQVLSRLTSLHIRIPNGRFLPNQMPFQNLTNYNITIANLWDIQSPSCSRALSLSHDTRLELPTCVKDLVLRADCLQLMGFVGLKDIFHDLINQGFNDVKTLSIKECNEMKYFLNTVERTPQMGFCNLEELLISDNLEFIEICHGHLPDESLCKLKMLQVTKCPKLLRGAPSHLLQRLQNLQNFSAAYCDSLVHAFELEGVNIKKDEDLKFLSKLTELTLEHLPLMTQIWKGNPQFISLQSLKWVTLDRCEKLRWLFSPILSQSLTSLERISISCSENLEEVFLKEEQVEEGKEIVEWRLNNRITSPSLHNLKRLYISFCDKLRNLFSLSHVKSLVQLESLEVCSCPLIKEIVSVEDGEEGASTEKIIFPRMDIMTLQSLGSLTSFCPSRSGIEWPELQSLTVDICPELETFGYGNQVTPKLKDVQVRIGEWLWMGDLNATVQYVFKEGFSSWARRPQPTATPGVQQEVGV